jgi:hypothetical protein
MLLGARQPRHHLHHRLRIHTPTLGTPTDSFLSP